MGSAWTGARANLPAKDTSREAQVTRRWSGGVKVACWVYIVSDPEIQFKLLGRQTTHVNRAAICL
jgi:hypothetical protein